MPYSFPHQLLKLRTEKQLSQAELATRLFVSRQAVSKWENGDAEPSIDKLILLAKVFNVSLDRLILGTNDFNQPVVKLNNIVKTFNSPVLNSLDLTIHNNERIALLGSNGAGKTTLVKIIEGALKPNKGTVKWYFSKNDSLNIMSQENILIPTLKVKEQIILTAAITKVGSKQRINYLLDQFKLSSQQNTIIAKLSGGQKRRLSLLLSVLRQSKLLILDEPTVGMDLKSIDYFWHFIEKVSGSILVITHDFNQIENSFPVFCSLKMAKSLKTSLLRKSTNIIRQSNNGIVNTIVRSFLMSIIAIQLKQVLRNRRFFLFTILLPGIWYVFMIQVASTSLPATGNFQLALLLLALLMGILGNSIVTFSKRICSNKDFYILQSHISHYSLWNYLFSQLITQVIINLFITIVIMILAIFLHTIEFNFITITSILLTNIIGIYLSVIGFAIGLSFDAPTVDAAGTPILFIIATFIIPWKHLLPANSFINFFTNVQKLFPTYYLYAGLDHLSVSHLGLLFVTAIITLLPWLSFIYRKLIN